MLAQKVALPPPPSALLYLIPLGEAASNICFQWLHRLRTEGLSVEMDLSNRKLKNAMRHANNLGVRYVAVVGDQELENEQLELKEMETGEVEKIAFSALSKRLQNG